MKKIALALLGILIPAVTLAAAVDVKVSHFPGGVSTGTEGSVFYDFVYPDESEVYRYSDDFMSYVSGDWTITTTEGGSSSATEALSSTVAGGALVVTNDNTTGDKDSLQRVGNAFLLQLGKRIWLKTRVSIAGTTFNDAATYSDVLVGLVATDTSPMVHTDGLVFKKDTGDTNWDFSSLENSGGTTQSAVATAVTNTPIDLGMYYDGKDMHLFVNGNKVAVKSDASLTDDTYLTPTIYVANGPAANGVGHQRALTVDYLMVAVER